MSAPESTSSKGRPSLLSETAPGVADSSSRILASLEGRAVAQPIPRRRSKKPLMAAALAVIGFGAFGAWQWQRIQQYIGNVPGAVPGAAYGVVVEGDGNFCTYLCGMEITPSAELPPEFVAIDVPARRCGSAGGAPCPDSGA